ncbi:hypothetical protein C3I27_04145 [Campylobacter jejuni]|uniref:Uncharacterized protein n=2 Tax=Campylobacter jejuni TaxID=197 RepID=A0AAX1Z4F6_CAMJU|nr:hypothetical protein C3I27_04145 [Campylobacter jejuni]
MNTIPSSYAPSGALQFTNLINQCKQYKVDDTKELQLKIWYAHKDENFVRTGILKTPALSEYLRVDMLESLISKLTKYFENKRHYQILFSPSVDGKKFYPKTKRKIVEALLHIFFSPKGEYHESIALCDTYLQAQSSTLRAKLRQLKNDKKIIHRMNDSRQGMAEHIVLNSSLHNIIQVALEQTKDEYRGVKNMGIRPMYQTVLNKFIADSAEERTARLDLAKNVKTVMSLDDITIYDIPDLATNQLWYRRFRYNKSHHYSIMKNGRYIMGDNSTNEKKLIKYLAYADCFNYDLKDAHPTLLSLLLGKYLYRYSASGEYIKQAGVLKSHLDTYRALGKDYYIKKTGIPKDVFKTMLYLTFNGGKVENKYSNKMKDLREEYGTNTIDKFIVEFKKIPLVQCIIDNLKPIISDFHRLNEERGVKFCNEFNNHRVIEGGLKKGQLLSYYLSGYESAFITRCIEWCQNNGIRVISYEYDGFVTDTDLTKPIRYINNPIEDMIDWASHNSKVGRVCLEPKPFI